ncbi:MAG: translocation/assembly module TamB domain-containing protein [Elainellaceae cyanobacterium]
MTQSPPPSPENHSDSGSDASLLPQQRRRSLKTFLVAGSVVTVGAVAGIGAAQYFVYNRLAPLVEDTLSKVLNRPVELGEVEGFTLSGLKIEGAMLPPTENSQDYARVETVQVGFDVWNVASSLVRDRTLPLTINLTNPEVYGYEDAEGQWLRLDIQEPEEKAPVSVSLNQINVKNATVILMPAPPALESPWDNEDFFDDLSALRASVKEPSEEAEEIDEAADPFSEVALVTTLETPSLPLIIKNVDAQATLRDENRFVKFEVTAEPEEGGTVALNGDADLKLLLVNAIVRTNQLQVAQFASLLPLPGRILSGNIDSNLDIRYSSGQMPSIKGTAQVNDLTAQMDVAPLPIADINSRLRFDEQTVLIEDTRLSYGDVKLTAGGSVDLNTGYALTAEVLPVSLEEVQNTVNLELPFTTAGAVTVDATVSGPLTQPVIEGTLTNVKRLQIDEVGVESLLANFRLTPPILDISQLTIIPVDGGRITGAGNVNLEADGGVLFNAQLSDLPGDALAANYGVTLPQNYAIGTIDAAVEVFGPFSGIQAIANWQLQNEVYPGQGEIRYDGNTVRVQRTQFNLSPQTGGGTATVDATLDLNQGSWRAVLDTANVNVESFTDQAQGQLNSNIRLSGRLDNLSPEAIALQGEARLTDAVITAIPNAELLIQPGDWNTSFSWTGNGIQIEQFTAPGIEASGFVEANLEGEPSLGAVDLAVALQQFQLGALEAFAPEAVRSQAQLQGTASFRGRVTGDITNPRLAGNLRLNQFAVNAIDFNPVLQGDVMFSLADGGTLDVQGGNDRIAVQLDDQFMPVRFLVRQTGDQEGLAPFTAEGRTEGDRLLAEVRNFRLNELAYNPLPGQNIGFLGGVVNANLNANLSDLSNPSVAGSVAIARLGVGYLTAERFTSDFTYRNGRVALNDADVNIGESTLQFSASADLADPALSYQATLAADARLQDFVDLLDLVDLASLQRGLQAPLYQGEELLTTESVGRPTASLLDQLAYITEVIARNKQAQDDAQTAVLPPFTELEGNLSAQINVAGSLASGVAADFDIEGNNWTWGPYTEPNQLVARGNLTDDIVTFEPFQFTSNSSVVSLEGRLGNTQQDAVLMVRDVPLEVLQDFVALPLDLAGDLQVNANIGGVLTNPTVMGAIEVVDPVLEGTPLQLAQVGFNYQEARLAVDGAAVIEEPERLSIQGSIPYALPFMTVQPESEAIALNIDLQNEGLAFLNLVSQGQAFWEGGEGDIDLSVAGTLAQPQILGTAMFQDGVISSPLLSDPVTGITGAATFNLDSVTVSDLNAQIRDGNINIQGNLPIFQAVSFGDDGVTPLTVTLSQLPIDFERFLIATVDGEIVVGRTALTPDISGQVSVSNGRIITTRLPMQQADKGKNGAAVDAAEDSNVIPASGETTFALGIQPEELPSFLNQVRFSDFTMVLADDLDIVGSPLFNISALGDLVINGTAADIRPEGVIQLSDGWINLFATQFRLDRDAPNTATFTPDRGLDPELDVQMVATVREVDRAPISPSSPFSSSEVADQSAIPTFGGLQTVEIFATVQGPATALTASLNTSSEEAPPTRNDVLVLTSDPSRSERQIVALIGGQAFASLENGGAIATVATFVGSGFLSNVGNDIADALGLSSFSIFPTAGDPGGESRLPLAIGIEAGFDITRDLSFSVLEILDGNLDPQFGLEYDINNNFRVRASSNLNDDTRTILEYRNQF